MSVPLAEMRLLYWLCEGIYGKSKFEKIARLGFDLDKAVGLSLKNNMGYYHCRRILDLYDGQLSVRDRSFLQDIVKNGECGLEEIRASMSLINENLPRAVLIKTYRGYPRIPNDLDILVDDFGAALNILADKGFRIPEDLSVHRDAQLSRDGCYNIHLHGSIHWADSEFMDPGFIFKNPRNIDFFGSSARIPNFDADFLMHVAHINFEPLHITLSDLVYLYMLAGDVDWQNMTRQAKKYHWERTFWNTIKLIDRIYHAVYDGSCPFYECDLAHGAESPGPALVLPRTLPRMHLAGALFEKKLFMQVLMKLPKSLRIILKGDAYDKFYGPAEDRPLSAH